MYPVLFSLNNLWLLLNYDEKTKEIAKWTANILILISAVALSIFIDAALLPFAFFAFFIAHLIWGFFALISKDMPLLGMFVFLIPIDIYAIYIRL